MNPVPSDAMSIYRLLIYSFSIATVTMSVVLTPIVKNTEDSSFEETMMSYNEYFVCL